MMQIKSRTARPRRVLGLLGVLLPLVSQYSGVTAQQRSTLLPQRELLSISAEISGLIAKDTVAELGRSHRVQASSGYDSAARYIAAKAKEYGLDQVQILQFPADGIKTYYTLKSSVGWEADRGQLWEVSPNKIKVADYDEMRVALADYSQSADVTADLVDVGVGDKAADYEGVDVSGKIVLAGGPVAAVHGLACDARGAVGILSYQPNQVTGWSGDYVDNVRWGHLSPYNPKNKFAFMISLRRARLFRDRLAAGQPIKLHAIVDARMQPGNYEVVSAVIPGTDLAQEEIAFSCHLCHQLPGANDDASGAAAILEVARTLKTLIDRGELPRPRRTIRFLWPPEINGTLAFLAQHSEEIKRIKAVIHCDMVGGDYSITKSVLHMTHTPASLPSCVNVVGDAFTQYAIAASLNGAMNGNLDRALISPEGSKDSLVADTTPFEMGSDHDVYEEGSFKIPVIYLRDWPDVFIHTNNDVPSNIDATKIKRSAFIAAASGYFLASAGPNQAMGLAEAVFADALERMPAEYQRSIATQGTGPEGARDSRAIIATSLAMDQAAISSVRMLAPADAGLEAKVDSLVDQLSGMWLMLTGQLTQEQKGKKTYLVLTPKEQPVERDNKHKRGREDEAPIAAAAWNTAVPSRIVAGPMNIYYYDYISDHARPEDLAIVKRIGAMPRGEILMYEILNLVDGQRSVQDIRDYLTVAYGSIPTEDVAAYLRLLDKIGVVKLNSKN
jgi:aminopeptidase YwaD